MKAQLALAERRAIRHAAAAAIDAARDRGEQVTPFDAVIAAAPAVELAHRLLAYTPHGDVLLDAVDLDADPATDAEAEALLDQPAWRELEAAEREAADQVVRKILILVGFDPDDVAAETEEAMPLLERDPEDAAGYDYALNFHEVDASAAETLRDPYAKKAWDRAYHGVDLEMPDVRPRRDLLSHGTRHRRAPCRGSRRSGAGSRAGPDDSDGDDDPPGALTPQAWRATAEAVAS